MGRTLELKGFSIGSSRHVSSSKYPRLDLEHQMHPLAAPVHSDQGGTYASRQVHAGQDRQIPRQDRRLDGPRSSELLVDGCPSSGRLPGFWRWGIIAANAGRR